MDIKIQSWRIDNDRQRKRHLETERESDNNRERHELMKTEEATD